MNVDDDFLPKSVYHPGRYSIFLYRGPDISLQIWVSIEIGMRMFT